MKANIKKFIASNVRHWLTLGAGILVAKGFLDQESAAVAAEGVSSGVTELVLGGVMFLIGQGWSLVDKFTGKKDEQIEEKEVAVAKAVVVDED